jgi:endonuclease/exonuclease/phosphatase family metal-dependent hydrolase
MAWYAPAQPADRAALDRWSAAVGPPVIVRRNFTRDLTPSRTLVLVSWNTGMGRGDVSALLADLRAKHPGAAVVLLLQEVFRKGPEVPSSVPPTARFASQLTVESAIGRPTEIEHIAEASGLDLYYVPSMRNGTPSRSDEDRGNAILSSLAMSDFDAIELPFERQRRVAVAATISGSSSPHIVWHLRVVSAHLDNLVGPKRVWFVAAELARMRQLRGLLQYLQADEAVVLGGDFNTWSGFDERAYREAARAFPETQVIDRRPTFGGYLRLDHLFVRLDDGWRSEFRRAESSYGSDHFPLVATITLP